MTRALAWARERQGSPRYQSAAGGSLALRLLVSVVLTTAFLTALWLVLLALLS